MSSKLKMRICVATMQPPSSNLTLIDEWVHKSQDPKQVVDVWRNTVEDNRGVVGSYQELYLDKDSGADVLAYIHDDVVCYERDWDKRVLAEFDDPKVGLVGFGGGLRHGHPDIYKTPYDYRQLARFGYLSNTRDAEVHGQRFDGVCRVAVLDGFGLVVRRDVLDRAGNGWPVNTPVGYVGYDYWVSCMARRLGYEVRLVGVDCQHLGGQTFVKMGLDTSSSQVQYNEAHRYVYEEFRDVLPFEVQG